eukprot:TRINITY_DN478_c0_g3_i2.p1 TRINITY_DN478_c0_g3~~TRINITY_DN478_c0_g3_i2.p1  ORF type:complete len:720 (+),score=97.72 TRINITY_DN478_c0_g3_i2:42-2162(+)
MKKQGLTKKQMANESKKTGREYLTWDMIPRWKEGLSEEEKVQMKEKQRKFLKRYVPDWNQPISLKQLHFMIHDQNQKWIDKTTKHIEEQAGSDAESGSESDSDESMDSDSDKEYDTDEYESEDEDNNKKKNEEKKEGEVKKEEKKKPHGLDIFYKTLLIIDEAHLLFEDKYHWKGMEDFIKLRKLIQLSFLKSGKNSVRVLYLTATPAYREPTDAIRLLNSIVDPKSIAEKAAKYRQPFPETEDELMNSGYWTMDTDNKNKMSEEARMHFRIRFAGMISYLNTENDPDRFAQISKIYMIPVNLSKKLLSRIEEHCVNKARQDENNYTKIDREDFEDSDDDTYDNDKRKKKKKLIKKKLNRDKITREFLECAEDKINNPRKGLDKKESTEKYINDIFKGSAIAQIRKNRKDILSRVIIYTPKVAALLRQIRDLDKKDQASGKLQKHAIFVRNFNIMRGIGVALVAEQFHFAMKVDNGIYFDEDDQSHVVSRYELNEKETSQNNFIMLSLKFRNGTSKTTDDEVANLAMLSDVNEIMRKVNKNENSKVRVILFDESFKEGIDFADIRHIHLFDEPRDATEFTQIVGRSKRFCGHARSKYIKGQGWPLFIWMYRAYNPYNNKFRDIKKRKIPSNVSIYRFVQSQDIDMETLTGKVLGVSLYDNVMSLMREVAVDKMLNDHLNRQRNPPSVTVMSAVTPGKHDLKFIGSD